MKMPRARWWRLWTVPRRVQAAVDLRNQHVFARLLRKMYVSRMMDHLETESVLLRRHEHKC